MLSVSCNGWFVTMTERECVCVCASLQTRRRLAEGVELGDKKMILEVCFSFLLPLSLSAFTSYPSPCRR